MYNMDWYISLSDDVVMTNELLLDPASAPPLV